MRKKKINWNLMMSILFLLVIVTAFIIFFMGVKQGWFIQQTFIPIDNDTTNGGNGGADTTTIGVVLFEDCTEVCNAEDYTDGWDALFDDGHDCHMVGADFIEYGYVEEDPLLSCCCDNIPIDEDEGYEVGDIVSSTDTGTGNILAGGDEYIGIEIDLDHVEVGGPCYLGARIWTTWNWADSVIECTGIQGTEMVDWVFYDSTGPVWIETDTYPQSNYVDLCPLVWDGVNDWELKMFKLLNLPDCELEYSARVEVYVCECN